MKKPYEQPRLAKVELIPEQSVLGACARIGGQAGWTPGAWNCGGDPDTCGPSQ
jgi:hypothetical protein